MGIREDAEEFCKNEYLDHLVYSGLAKRESSERTRGLLLRLAEQEYRHYTFWKRYVNGYEPRVSELYLRVFFLMRLFLGVTFTLKLLERHEEKTIAKYREHVNALEGEEKRELEEIISEEVEHERSLLAQIDDRVVKYMGFIALGLADAIIEISGVHAGFLGVTSSTLIAGIAGLVVGFAASIAMGSAAYLQAKSEVGKRPLSAALTTSVSYIIAVVILALPYFALKDMIEAFALSIILALLLSALFTFYSSVINDKKVRRELLENSALLLGTAFATYLFGDILGRTFGIRPFVQG